MDRVERQYYRILNTPIGFPLNVKGRKFRRFGLIKRIINLFSPPKRDFLPNIKPYGGSGYWNLSKEAIYYIFDFIDNNPDFVRFFRRSFASDELFFHTILLNSPLKDKIVSNSLRYMNWSGAGKHPAILGEEDLGALRSSSHLFARKFDTTVDSHILDLIDKYLLGEG